MFVMDDAGSKQGLIEHGRSDQAGDLRRRLSPGMAERIVIRLEFLPDQERELLRSVFVDHRPMRELAPLVGSSERSLRRRIKRAVSRLLGARFSFVLEHRGAWTPTRRRIATLHYIDGMSVRQTAAKAGLSFHAVRRHRDAIEAIFDAAQQRPAPLRRIGR